MRQACLIGFSRVQKSTMAFFFPKPIEYAIPSLLKITTCRVISSNQLTGSVEALGELTEMKKLCVKRVWLGFQEYRKVQYVSSSIEEALLRTVIACQLMMDSSHAEILPTTSSAETLKHSASWRKLKHCTTLCYRVAEDGSMGMHAHFIYVCVGQSRRTSLRAVSRRSRILSL